MQNLIEMYVWFLQNIVFRIKTLSIQECRGEYIRKNDIVLHLLMAF